MNARTRLIVGIVLLVLGAVWFLQGISVLPGSFMRGSTLWTVIGAALAVGGVLLLSKRRT